MSAGGRHVAACCERFARHAPVPTAPCQRTQQAVLSRSSTPLLFIVAHDPRFDFKRLMPPMPLPLCPLSPHCRLHWEVCAAPPQPRLATPPPWFFPPPPLGAPPVRPTPPSLPIGSSRASRRSPPPPPPPPRSLAVRSAPNSCSPHAPTPHRGSTTIPPPPPTYPSPFGPCTDVIPPQRHPPACSVVLPANAAPLRSPLRAWQSLLNLWYSRALRVPPCLTIALTLNRFGIFSCAPPPPPPPRVPMAATAMLPRASAQPAV